MIYKKLLEFQKLGITLKRDGTNPHFNSNYVTLNEVLDKVKKPLNDMGIIILQTSEKDGLRTVLLDTQPDENTHGSNGFLETKVECFMPYTETSTAQKLGSNLTYLRRYSLITLLGLEDSDDDGNEASQPRHNAPIASKQPQGRTEVQNMDKVLTISEDEPTGDPMGLVCTCGQMKVRKQSHTATNPDRWYYTCPKPRGQECKNSFVWEDEGDSNFRDDYQGDLESKPVHKSISGLNEDPR